MKEKIKEAIAIEYGDYITPIVTAKGSAEVADLIIEEAKRQGVFIAEDKQLVAALSQVEIDGEIPESLFRALAVVLSWVFWLKGITPNTNISQESKQKSDSSFAEDEKSGLKT